MLPQSDLSTAVIKSPCSSELVTTYKKIARKIFNPDNNSKNADTQMWTGNLKDPIIFMACNSALIHTFCLICDSAFSSNSSKKINGKQITLNKNSPVG